MCVLAVLLFDILQIYDSNKNLFFKYVLSDTMNYARFQYRYIPYILESNPHPFYNFRGLKNQMRVRFAVVSWILEK